MDDKSTERRPNIKSNEHSANLWLERDAAKTAPHPSASLLWGNINFRLGILFSYNLFTKNWRYIYE